MKRSLVLVLVLFAVALCACGKPLPLEQPAQIERPQPSSSGVDSSASASQALQYVQVGNNSLGYVAVPQGWQVVEGQADALVYQSGEAGYTLRLGPGSGQDAAAAADAVLAEMQAAGSEDCSAFQHSFNGYEGYQCYGSLPGNQLWVANLFADGGGTVRLLSLRGPASGFMDIFGEVEKSYQAVP